jgi:hypothetical protein
MRWHQFPPILSLHHARTRIKLINLFVVAVVTRPRVLCTTCRQPCTFSHMYHRRFFISASLLSAKKQGGKINVLPQPTPTIKHVYPRHETRIADVCAAAVGDVYILRNRPICVVELRTHIFCGGGATRYRRIRRRCCKCKCNRHKLSTQRKYARGSSVEQHGVFV